MFRACLLTLLAASAARADLLATFDLQLVGTPGATAEFDISLAVSGNSAASIEVVQLGLYGSSAALTGGGTDFSRFSFAIDPGLTGWAELVPVNTGLGLLAPLDALAGPFIPGPGTTALGRLTVNLSGLADGAYVVSLSGGPVGLSSDAGGTVDGDFVPAFASADPSVVGVVFAQLNGAPLPVNTGTPNPEPQPVPAPASVVLAGVAGLALLVRRRSALVCCGAVG